MKNYIKIAFVAAFAAIAGYGVYTSQKTEMMSDLALANVEALAAYGEGTTTKHCCGNTGVCMTVISSSGGIQDVAGIDFHSMPCP